MRKVFLVVFLILVMACVYELMSTYALLESNQTYPISTEIGKWVIKINDSNVTTINEFVINNFNISTSNYVKSDKIAPGINGYFDIVIDSSSSDVGIRYDVSLDLVNVVNNEFIIRNVQELNSYPITRTQDTTYTGLIDLNDINNDIIHTVRVFIEWHNDDSNNYTDSIWGLNGSVDVVIPVSVRVSQYLGEEIIAYTSGIYTS